MIPHFLFSIPLELCLLLSNAVAPVKAATITTPPLVPRAQATLPPDLIGYTYSSGKYETWNCRSSSAFQTIGSYGQCCSTARPDCFMATTCISGSIMANADFSSTCSGTKAQTSCVTGTIYHTIGDQNPIMNYQCWPEWNGGNWEATIVTTTPSSAPSSPASARATFPADAESFIASPTSTSTPTSINPSGTSIAASTNTNEKSKAWVAGPVIGAILGAVLFTFLGIWLYRRHLKRQQPSSGFNKMAPENESKIMYAYEHELHGRGNPDQGPAELSDQMYHEMYGSRPKTVIVEADSNAVGIGGVQTHGRQISPEELRR